MQHKRSISVIVAAAALALPAAAAAQQDAAPTGHHPTTHNRPVLPHGAAPETATFLDPSAQVDSPQNILLGGRTYVAPFAKLLAADDPDDLVGSQPKASISIGSESNVQDSVRIQANAGRDEGDDLLDDDDGVEIGDRVSLAHGASVKGPARIGVDGHDVEVNKDGKPETFVSFTAEVDGAIIEKNAQVSALARVAPGIRLESGWVVKPGKNIATEADLEDPDKVRELTEADVEFAEAVVNVNTQLAEEYTTLHNDSHSNVRGINFDPGDTTFNHARNLPETGATGPANHAVEEVGHEQDYCDGAPARDTLFRNRIIGAVCLEDSRSQLSHKLGHEVSLRADEGEPFSVGHIHSLGDNTTFHALEHADLEVGDNVSYGDGAIVHGGERTLAGFEGATRVEDDVTLGDLSLTFRSLIGEGATVGYKSAVINSVIEPGDVVEDRTIVLNGDESKVEW